MRITGNGPAILRFQPWNGLFTATAEKIALLATCVIFISNMVGCSVSGDKTSKEPPPALKSLPSTVLPKDPGAMSQTLTIQDLSVREDRGQTILLVKFSQSVSQFRHFPLPNPARIVLDIFGNPNRSAQADSYRIDTSSVAT